ncbi:unnamed protein product [Prorocentrum cordatum]|uniref:Uncharacterized protein n=2 Tax=Prorocentrum cordatum TaxID=2364126 RepID=A0ABN9SVP1_9DINO|nr:unnamed protein product [Polarella glacialis]
MYGDINLHIWTGRGSDPTPIAKRKLQPSPRPPYHPKGYPVGMVGSSAAWLLTAALKLDVVRLGSAIMLAEHQRSYVPKYARVDGDIETMWQLPHGMPKGLLFIAHGCKHQGTDVFSDVGPDGWRLEECSNSNSGSCLGLPEEVKLRQTARRRGYVVVSVSGGSGSRSCWHMTQDPSRVSRAIRHVVDSEELPKDIAVLATGASSGGAFMGTLAAPLGPDGGLPNLKCIVPQISGTAGENRGVPTLYVHMPRDSKTAARIEEQIRDLRERDVRVWELKVLQRPVTEAFLEQCMPAEAARQGLKALRHASLLDSRGFLKNGSRHRLWVKPLQEAVGATVSDTFEADASCVSELMNVADAIHEFTAEYSEQMSNFCEGADIA